MTVPVFFMTSGYLEGFTTEATNDISEFKPIRVDELQPHLEFDFENPIFNYRILISHTEHLVNCPWIEGQNTHPIHRNPHHQLELISQL